jgi:hypothetical protein
MPKKLNRTFYIGRAGWPPKPLPVLPVMRASGRIAAAAMRMRMRLMRKSPGPAGTYRATAYHLPNPNIMSDLMPISSLAFSKHGDPEEYRKRKVALISGLCLFYVACPSISTILIPCRHHWPRRLLSVGAITRSFIVHLYCQ